MATPTRWWKAHCQVLKDWTDAKRELKERFSKKEEQPLGQKGYTGNSSPEEHFKNAQPTGKARDYQGICGCTPLYTP